MPTALQVERWAALVVAVIAAIAWWWVDAEIAQSFAKELLGALIAAASVAAGFLTTSLSILLPIAATSTGRKLAQSGYRADLFRYMRSAIYSCMLLAALAVVGFFYLGEKAVDHRIALLLVFNASHASVALLRVAEILMGLFERASEPEDKDG